MRARGRAGAWGPVRAARRIRWAGRCRGCPGRWCCRTTASDTLSVTANGSFAFAYSAGRRRGLCGDGAIQPVRAEPARCLAARARWARLTSPLSRSAALPRAAAEAAGAVRRDGDRVGFFQPGRTGAWVRAGPMTPMAGLSIVSGQVVGNGAELGGSADRGDVIRLTSSPSWRWVRRSCRAGSGSARRCGCRPAGKAGTWGSTTGTTGSPEVMLFLRNAGVVDRAGLLSQRSPVGGDRAHPDSGGQHRSPSRSTACR